MPPPPPPPDVVGTTIEKLYAYAFANPLMYFFFDFGIAALIGTFFLFLQDIQRWQARRKAQAKMQARQAARAPEGYVELGDDAPAAQEEAPPDLDEMKRELIRVTDKAEELEIKNKVSKKPTSEAAAAAKLQLKQLQERREELKLALGLGVVANVKKPKEDRNKEPSCISQFLKSNFMLFMQNCANGTMSVVLYFADLLSDLQVVQMLFDTGNTTWACISVVILVAQFVVVYARVIPYLSSTFGESSTIYRLFLWLGFPWGCLLLDGLMFLEPFGLLGVLPFPEWVWQREIECARPCCQQNMLIHVLIPETWCFSPSHPSYFLLHSTGPPVCPCLQGHAHHRRGASFTSRCVSMRCSFRPWLRSHHACSHHTGRNRESAAMRATSVHLYHSDIQPESRHCNCQPIGHG